MGIFLWMLGAFGIGYVVGFISRELQTMAHYQIMYLKARKETARDLAYDKAVEDETKKLSKGLPDPEAVTEDKPEPDDEEEKEKRRGTKTFFS